MSNVVQVYDLDDMNRAREQRRLRDTVGKALGRAYPTVQWLVTVPEDGSIVQFRCPSLTENYGMTMHATANTEDLERKAVRMGGEYLERFRVSRERPSDEHVPKNIRGIALGEKAGEC